MNAMASRETNVQDLARRCGVTTTTLYMYINGNGAVKAPGQKLFDAVHISENIDVRVRRRPLSSTNGRPA